MKSFWEYLAIIIYIFFRMCFFLMQKTKHHFPVVPSVPIVTLQGGERQYTLAKGEGTTAPIR
jgi:predicted membrane-bound dolichyl-phosphate-mannose-protein mannosyltransferase